MLKSIESIIYYHPPGEGLCLKLLKVLSITIPQGRVYA